MTVMLPHTPPRIDTALERPLLTASSHVTKQAAGVAMRSWWRRTMPLERLEKGLVLRRREITHHNNDAGKNGMPVLKLCFEDEDGHEIILAAFADQSAVVMRALYPATYPVKDRPEGIGDEFVVLPIVLRISSVARFRDHPIRRDGLGDITMTMRGTKNSILALGRKDNKDAWVNLEAGWTTEELGIDHDVRQELLLAFKAEIASWSHLISDLPPLADPESGHPLPGPAGPKLLAATGCPAGLTVAAPAALPWRAYTQDEADAMRSFCRDICFWLQMRTAGELESVELDLYAAQPGQKRRKTETTLRLICVRRDGNRELGKRLAQHLQPIVQDILSSDLAPAPLSRFVGQVERDFKDRRTWIEPDAIARVFAKSYTGKLSNHAILTLRSKLDPFWREMT